MQAWSHLSVSGLRASTIFQAQTTWFALERAKEYRKAEQGQLNAFESAADAQDLWNKALRENEFWSNLQFSEQAAATNLADSTMAGEVKARIGDKRLAIESRAAQPGWSSQRNACCVIRSGLP